MSYLTQMYGIAAVFGLMFIIYMVRSLKTMGQIGSNPQTWRVFVFGFALIGASPILEYIFIQEFVWFVFYTYGIYFAVGNVLILLVLYQHLRGLED